jgi:hypothetical protein
MRLTENSEAGIIRRVPHPDFSTVQFDIRAKATKIDPTYRVNGQLIMGGIIMYFRTDEFVGHGRVIDMFYCTAADQTNGGEGR